MTPNNLFVGLRSRDRRNAELGLTGMMRDPDSRAFLISDLSQLNADSQGVGAASAANNERCAGDPPHSRLKALQSAQLKFLASQARL